MSPNVIHSYPSRTLFGDGWWFLMLMPSIFVGCLQASSMSKVHRVSEPDAATLPCGGMDSPDTIGYSWRVCRFWEVLILRFCRSALVVLGLPARQEAHLRSLEKESWVNCAGTMSSNVTKCHPLISKPNPFRWWLVIPDVGAFYFCWMFASLKHVQSPEGFRTWCSYPSLCLDGQSWQNWVQLEGLWVQFWSLGFVGLHLLSLACRLARKCIYEAWRRRVGWTVLEQFHPQCHQMSSTHI